MQVKICYSIIKNCICAQFLFFSKCTIGSQKRNIAGFADTSKTWKRLAVIRRSAWSCFDVKVYYLTKKAMSWTSASFEVTSTLRSFAQKLNNEDLDGSDENLAASPPAAHTRSFSTSVDRSSSADLVDVNLPDEARTPKTCSPMVWGRLATCFFAAARFSQ